MRSDAGAPKPENFEAMAAAFASGDQGRIEHEKSLYKLQLQREGWTERVEDERSYRDD